jgi:type IV pilus modification protein PilV
MKTRQYSGNSGFSLLEVMIAMVILGAGMIGSAMIHIKNTKYSHNSLMDSQRSMLALEIVEHMTINFDEAIGGSYDIAMTATTPVLLDDCEISTAQCSSLDLALYDIIKWRTRVAAVLPGGSASVLAVLPDPDAVPPEIGPPEITVIIQQTVVGTVTNSTFVIGLW